MKTFINLFFLCLVVLQFVACKKDATQPSGALPVTSGNIAGNFTVGTFVDDGSNSSLLNGFTFTFNTNGTIIATNGSDTFNGTWTIDDSNSAEIKINFTEAPLNQLNKGWHITELTTNHMLLSDDSDEHEGGDDDHAHGNSTIEFERD